jgi:2-polyprenyl-3-methyl-5-hydroxy-6-metoxy-1,4-benzoquinol methylase
MISQEQFLEKELEWGLHHKNPKFKKLTDLTAKQLLPYKDMSFIDYGAGTGCYSLSLHEHGFDVKAMDVFKSHRDYMKKELPELKVIARPVKADFMLFIEVAEHMTDEEIEKALDTIQPKMILFSSTSEKTVNDEMWGHVNIKTQDEWVNFWFEHGYRVEAEFIRPTKWTKLLKKIAV